MTPAPYSEDNMSKMGQLNAAEWEANGGNDPYGPDDVDAGYVPGTVTAGDLRTGDTVRHSGHNYRVTVRTVAGGLLLVSGLTADNAGWFRLLADAGTEFVRVG
jgi:hypothetical protein